jgi:hypothetical protein
MLNDERMPNDEIRMTKDRRDKTPSSFGLRHSFGIGASAFVIPFAGLSETRMG